MIISRRRFSKIPIVIWNAITGTTTFLMSMIMNFANGDPLTPVDTIRIQVTDENAVELEILEGAYGDAIGSFVTDLGVNPQPTSINATATGLIQDASSLSLVKSTWALAQTVPKTNALSTKLTLGIQGETPEGGLSEYDEIVVPYSFLVGGQPTYGYCFNSNGKIYTDNNHGGDIFEWFPYENSLKESYSLQITNGLVNNAMGAFYDEVNDVFYSGAAASGIYELAFADYIYNGGTGVPTTYAVGIKPYNLDGHNSWNQINSKPVLIGARSTNIVYAYSWDGVSAWTETTFGPEIISQVAPPYTITSLRAFTGEAGEIFVMCYNTVATAQGILKGVLSVGTDPSVPTNWTWDWVVDFTVQGYVDGNGTVAKLQPTTTGHILPFGIDGNGNSIMALYDSGNSAYRILTHNGGVDVNEALNWDLSTPSWSATAGALQAQEYAPTKISESSIMLMGRSCYDFNPLDLSNTLLNANIVSRERTRY